MEQKALELGNVSVVKGGKRILGPIDLSILKGESVAVLGPNGSGKTTLSRLFTGDAYPYYDEGCPPVIRIFGEERYSHFGIRRHIGMVSMDLQNQFSPDVTVFEVVCSGLFCGTGVHPDTTVTEDIVSKVGSAATMMGIDDILDREVSKLSLGEMRRALIARALVHEPEMLILDEPMTGLDIVMRSRFRSMLDVLMGHGIGIVLVTHDLSDIPCSLDRIIAMRGGRIIADGAKKDILTDSVISDLYGESIKVMEDNGTYQMMLGGSRK